MKQIGEVSTTSLDKERNLEPDRLHRRIEFVYELVSLLLDDRNFSAACSLMWVEEVPLSYFIPLLNSL